MRRAIELASGFHTHPNPRVGAVVVDPNGATLGEGAHLGPGRHHAEVVALEQAGERARGSTMYVTLEPCTHHGRTPPCVEAILAAGIARVVIGAGDPDSRVAGRGVAMLREGGVIVTEGLLEAETRLIDPGYFRQRETGLPRIVLKLAMTIDGSVAATDGTSQWITSEESRTDAHRLRAGMDAVMVGAGTLRVDDPWLEVRAFEVDVQPRPVVVAGREPLPRKARLWERDPIVISVDAIDVPAGTLVQVPGDQGFPDPEKTARALANLDVYDILLEGGPKLVGSFWRSGLITEGVVYLAGKVGGGAGIGAMGGAFANIGDARPVTIHRVDRIGPDLRIEFA